MGLNISIQRQIQEWWYGRYPGQRSRLRPAL